VSRLGALVGIAVFRTELGFERLVRIAKKGHRALLVTWRSVSSDSVPEGRQSGAIRVHCAAQILGVSAIPKSGLSWNSML
jgi:hypothetical protein